MASKMKVLKVFAAILCTFSVNSKEIDALNRTRRYVKRGHREGRITFPYNHHNHESIGWPIAESVRITQHKTNAHKTIGFDFSGSGSSYGNLYGRIARKAIELNLEKELNTNRAKNIILVVSEDLPVSILRTTRIHQQCLGDFCYGELSNVKPFRNYANDIAVARSECYNDVEPDVACAATAILTGAKSNKGTIALNHKVEFNQRDHDQHYNHHLTSIAAWAQLAGKRTGLVTSGRVTSPGVSPYYAHSSNYRWESDKDMAEDNVHLHGVDIASQLINDETGSNLNVVLGGGRRKFVQSYRYGGERLNRKNLLKEWLHSKQGLGESAYIEAREELSNICRYTDYLFGLFDLDNLNDKDHPTIAEMTAAAIKVLDRPDGDGFLLFLHSSKEVYSHDDLTENERVVNQHLQIIEAIETAMDMTDSAETLIVGTSDHYFRNVNLELTKKVEQKHVHQRGGADRSKLGWMDWAYSIVFGPRVTAINDEDVEAKCANDCDIRDNGDDNLVFAYGPFSHLCSGTIQQNFIAYFIGYAACIGEGLHMCDDYYV